MYKQNWFLAREGTPNICIKYKVEIRGVGIGGSGGGYGHKMGS